MVVCENEILKICDFGMAKDVRYVDYFRREAPVMNAVEELMLILRSEDYCFVFVLQGLLPVKWMSPESIFDKLYTQASDV